ncbi:MAG: hypothetical protein AAGF95_23025 [Chloroflexota bacterium]
MRNCNQVDLIVREVPNAARFFRGVVGLSLQVAEPRFAQLDGDSITLMFSHGVFIRFSLQAVLFCTFKLKMYEQHLSMRVHNRLRCCSSHRKLIGAQSRQ